MEDEDFKDDLTRLKILSIASQSLIKMSPIIIFTKKMNSKQKTQKSLLLYKIASTYSLWCDL